MPGIGTAIGGIAGAFMDGMGGGGGGSGSGYAPQDAQSAIYGDLGLDASGWNVNFSGTQSNGSNKAGIPSAMESIGVGLGGISPLMVVGFVAVVGLVVWTKSRSKK